MKFFVDTADVDTIAELTESGMIDGVTTNPSLIAKSGRDIFEVIKEICDLVPGPVSAEVSATERGLMIQEGEKLAGLAPNVCVKLPTTWDGVSACHALTRKGISTNMTLVFSAAQAILVAKAGATFVSPFVGRLDDTGADGMGLIEQVCTIYAQYEAFGTEVLVASVRNVNHVIEAGQLGAHVATLPPAVIKSLVNHPLTDKGLAAFLSDWGSTGQSIL